MRLDDYRTSDNVRDQGQGAGGFGGGAGFGGGGGLGLIIGLVASRFGIAGVVVVLLGAWMLGMFGGGGSGVVSPAQPGVSASGATNDAATACAQGPTERFSCQVLASTEDTWAKIFQASGQRYQPAGFAFFTGGTTSGCGAAQSAMGPFYCPSDNSVYLDTSFFDELQTKFGAAGDFAQAYVIAHEVGHHIQTLTGVSDKVRAIQARSNQVEGNRAQVAMELQADCYAGVWAANNRDRLEPGDVEEGLRAAQAIGDDTLQRAAQGRVVPESFTHGTSAQRQQWLRTGLQSGDPAACDTFGGRLG
ncbi:MAG: YpfJ protein, zinc metalloprotease superfamily [uncultured Sphingomonadaceae bacterium]|uniref:YpfJ protein, zinc metalloprotease superfamily n=1 Tax=uncultured Sphingomonadaceae bacterium TaxID=169976 RepID=A0A6J4T4P5_9SPHN|nr:MAG: YpfJ protein, zinc metalloprotease superfamily [uncultured Sphingomonadaceae bacterium]